MQSLTEEDARSLLLTKRPTFNLTTTFVDPNAGSKFCVLNFIPSPESTPDKLGIYGYVKVRAVEDNEEAAETASTNLIMKVDQFAPNIICSMGVPLPLFKTANQYEKIVAEDCVKLVNENYSNARSKFIKTQKENEQAAQRELEERQRALEVGEDIHDDLYTYAMTISKVVSWINTAQEIERGHKELLDKIKKARDKIKQVDETNTEFCKKYLSFIREKEMAAGLVEGRDEELDKQIQARQEKLKNWYEDSESYLNLFKN